MKQVPKGLAMLSCSVDKTLAGGILAVALIGGAPLTAHSADIMGGVKSPATQQVSQKQQVSGTVIDETGEPMLGVSVIEVGTKTGVATDLDGNFTLNVPQGAKLQFSYIGYKTQTITATGQSHIEVKMEPDNNVLDDVVVVGYGTVKKRDLTGAVSSVKSDVITLTPTANPMAALQGRVAGLDISQTSGQPGAGLNIQLRGNRSITASGKPLFLIDGMPGDYSTINPNDIESIEVLKDASSTAVYGSEGSNGVIIITTKKGQEGKMKVNFDAYVGINGWASVPKMTSPEENIRTRELAYQYGGKEVPDDSDLAAYKEALARGETIDWVDELLRTGITQNYSLSMSGGTEKTQAYFSLNYNDVTGQYRNSDYKVYSTSVRLNTKLNNWLTGGVHVQGSYTDRNQADSHLNDGLRSDPFGTLYNEDGSLKPFPLIKNTDQINLLLDNKENYRNASRNLRLYVQPYIRINPLKGLTIESRLSGNFNYSNTNKYLGYGSWNYYNKAGSAALDAPFSDYQQIVTANKQNSFDWGYTWENILTYNFKLSDIHDFTVTGVTSWSSNQYDNTSAYATSISSNKQYWTNLGVAKDPKPTVGSGYTMHKRMGYVARLNYTLMGKYLFSASVRRDGDSVLAAGHHWATFPAFSAGWRISDENFMESTRDWMSNLKLRIGYGETGDAGLKPYASWSSLTTGQIGLGDVLTDITVYPNPISNKDLTWERSKSWNFGIDLGLLNNRIDLAAEYYITNTNGVIWQQAIPVNNGGYNASTLYNMNRNIAETRNQGFELSVTSHNFDTKDFGWSTTLTFSTNKEQVTSLGRNATEYISNVGTDYTLHIGDPVKSYRQLEFAGIWQLDEEADAKVFGARPGEIKVNVPNMRRVSEGVWEKTTYDSNGNPVVTTYDSQNQYKINDNDRVIIGHETPDWQLGLQNNFRWKWFDLSVYMMFRYGQMFRYEPIGWYTGHGGSFPEHFNYWTPENPSNDFPALNSERNWQKATGNESIYWVDGSFFKVKNITLGYTMPKNACNMLHIQNLRLYGTVTNPIIVAKNEILKGYDPEQMGNFNHPLTRQVVFGLNLTF